MAPVTAIAVLHPGEMGSAVGAALRAAGHDVRWDPTGRSAATVTRAAAADMTAAATLTDAVAAADIVLSVCPPGAALDVAGAVATTKYAGIYVDANAVAPATSRAVAEVVGAAGATFVDGGIVGPPPVGTGTTRLFLSGPSWPTAVVSDLFAATPLATVVVSEVVGDASAVKVAYAAWTKGSAALLLAVRAYARRAGVDATVLDEWERSQPGLAARSDAARANAAPKAWRWIAEMEEIAAALEAEGLPGGFHHSAAVMYEQLDP